MHAVNPTPKPTAGFTGHDRSVDSAVWLTMFRPYDPHLARWSLRTQREWTVVPI